MAEWETYHLRTPEEFREIERNWVPKNKLDKILTVIEDNFGRVAALGALASVVGLGIYNGMNSPMPNKTKDNLRKAAQPRAVKVGRKLATLDKANPSKVQEIVSKDGKSVTLHFESFDTNEWYTVEATMALDDHGIPEPNSTNDVSVHVSDYVNDGEGYYGGDQAAQSEAEVYSYPDKKGSDVWVSEYTRWNKGVHEATVDDFSLPEKFRLSDAGPHSKIMLEAENQNKRWSRYIDEISSVALSADIADAKLDIKKVTLGNT